MSAVRQSVFSLTLAAAVFAGEAEAEPVALASAKTVSLSTNLMPPLPQMSSPVAYFRRLLLMSPVERNQSLTNKAPEIRARIMAKVREYQALGPDERELRLQATELRWYLTPLMRTPAENRPASLESVPAELRDLVQARLAQWDLLPPSLQQEFLANDQTLRYFARLESKTNSLASTPEQQRIAEQFNQFFELTPEEKQRTLGVLSGAERVEMEKTLKAFDQLPVRQRVLCIRNYAKFTGMTGAERTEFLKNAESWSRMSPTERQAWRDLVARVPLWPPTPAPMAPPLPPSAPQKSARTNMATN
ncbi:MAG TPA: DUF3106 domain-containing protein [Verrucomicrobiae bacterium]